MIADNHTPSDDHWIDLLVDGELDRERRRALLTRLDAIPDGWKRCALAFLEAQTIREAFATDATAVRQDLRPKPFPTLVHTDPPASQSPAFPSGANGAASKRRRAVRMLSSVSAFAAGVFLAFVLGRVSAGPAQPGAAQLTGNSPLASTDHPTPIAGSDRPAPSAPAKEDTADESTHTPFSDSPSATESGTAPSPPSPAVLVSSSGPVINPAWMHAPPTPLPPTVRQRVAERGYEIKQSRRVLRVILRDGRHVQIPVEETNLRFVGNHTF